MLETPAILLAVKYVPLIYYLIIKGIIQHTYVWYTLKKKNAKKDAETIKFNIQFHLDLLYMKN